MHSLVGVHCFSNNEHRRPNSLRKTAELWLDLHFSIEIYFRFGLHCAFGVHSTVGIHSFVGVHTFLHEASRPFHTTSRRLGEGGGITELTTKVQLFLSPQNCLTVTPPLLPNRVLCVGDFGNCFFSFLRDLRDFKTGNEQRCLLL